MRYSNTMFMLMAISITMACGDNVSLEDEVQPQGDMSEDAQPDQDMEVRGTPSCASGNIFQAEHVGTDGLKKKITPSTKESKDEGVEARQREGKRFDHCAFSILEVGGSSCYIDRSATNMIHTRIYEACKAPSLVEDGQSYAVLYGLDGGILRTRYPTLEAAIQSATCIEIP